ncbi:hypothetical protein Tco_0281604 [Tanacetum coccineum]
MYHPRFIKVIIHHFLSKDKSISMKKRMFMHIAQDGIILGTLRFVSKDEDTQVYGALIPAVMTTPKIRDSPAYQTYLAFATGTATPKPKRIYKKHDSPMIKTTTTSPKETPSKKKSSPAKKDKKAPETTDKSKGIDLLSVAALLEDAQMKKVPDKPKGKKTSKNEGTGTKPGVPDVPKDQSKSENESWGESADDDDSNDDDSDDVSDDDGNDDDSNDDGNNDASDNERTESDEDENTNLNQNDDDIKEEYEEEYVHTPENYESTNDENEHVNEEEYDRIDEELYKDMHAKLKDIEHGEEGKGDVEMTGVGHDNVTQETTYDQVEDDAHLLEAIKSQVPAVVEAHLGTRHGNTIQQVLQEEVKSEIEKYMEFMEKFVKANIIDQVKIQLPHILPKEVSDFATPVIQSTVLNHLRTSGREDKDKDEDPPVGLDQGLKRRKTSKDSKPSKGPKSKESKTSSSKGTKSLPKSSGKSAQAEELVFEVADIKMPQNQGSDLGNTGEQPNVEAAPKHDWFKKPERPPTLDLDWNVGESFDFRQPQTWFSKIAQAEKPPLSFDKLMRTPIDFSAYVMNHLKIDHLTQNYLVGLAFNLLKGTCRSRVELESYIEECYKAEEAQARNTSSTTKKKAAKYDIPGIKDMVPLLWSPIKVSYDRYGFWGILHCGPKRQRFYRFASNRVSKHDVYSTKWIIVVTKVKVMKWYDYGYLEEIEVQIEDQQLYKFKEGDFPRLHMHDIEDMLLLLVHKKLSNLERDVIFDLGVVLRITPYTVYNNPQGIIYVDKYKRNRLMRSDDLYKFSDGTHTSVRSVLHGIASNLRMVYLPKRRWSNLDRKRSRIMMDKQLLNRRLMRN